MFSLKFKTKARESVDREIELYKRIELTRVDEMIVNYRKDQFSKFQRSALTSLDQTEELEHEYHSGREEKHLELAKLDGQIEARKVLLRKEEVYQGTLAELATSKALAEARLEIIKEQKNQLDRADENIKVVIGKLPKVDVDKIAVSVGPVNANK